MDRVVHSRLSGRVPCTRSRWERDLYTSTASRRSWRASPSTEGLQGWRLLAVGVRRRLYGPAPRTASESAGGRPAIGRSTVRAGWQCRARARTDEGGGPAVADRDPSHLHLAPAERGGSASPRPGPVRTAGRLPGAVGGVLAVADRDPSHLHLAPTGLGGSAGPCPSR